MAPCASTFKRNFKIEFTPTSSLHRPWNRDPQRSPDWNTATSQWVAEPQPDLESPPSVQVPVCHLHFAVRREEGTGCTGPREQVSPEARRWVGLLGGHSSEQKGGLE